MQVVAGVGGLPLELMTWPTVLIAGFQACDLVEGQRNLLVKVGDAS